MKRAKKCITILLAAALAVSSMAGCSGGTSTSDSGKSTATSGEKVKLKAIMLKHPLTQDLNKMEWLTKIEKEAGVQIEWQQITADWDQKKGTLLASGDIPDLIVGANAVIDSDFSQFPGLFQDLTDLIQKDAPNIQKMFSEKPETKKIATQLDGKIYGIPKYQRFWPQTVSRQYINKQWLDKLGLKAPTNWDELYNVLMAFKTKDPNGNGKADEIPMDFSPTPTNFGYFNASILLSSTGITLSNASPDGYFVENGKVKNFYVDDRYKQLVVFLNKCFKSGLINPETFTQDYTKYQSVARGTGNLAKVGFTWGWEVTDRVGNTLAPQYESIAPLKVSADSSIEPSWDYDYDSLNYGSDMIEMSSKCANKDAAMKFIDKFYDPTVSMQVLFGSLGTNIKDNGDKTYSVLPPTDSKMDPGTWKWTSSMADDGPMYISDSLKLTLGTDMVSNQKQTEPLKSTLDKIDKNKNVMPDMYIKYSSADNNQLALVRTSLNTLGIKKWANWIKNGGVEQEWDTYVANCNKAGLQNALKIKQQYYDNYMKTSK